MRKRWIAIILACAAAAPTPFAAEAGVVAAGPDQLAFSKQNMDTSVSPSTDFYRYAAGGWLKRVKRPEQHSGYGFFEIVLDQVQQQMNVLLAKAAADAPNASPGTPAQQVGTLYNAYMNTAARNAAGMKPIQPFLEKADAIKDLDGLAAYLAQNEIDGGPGIFLQISPGQDFDNNTVTSLFVQGGTLGLPEAFEDVFEEPAGGPRITAYRNYLIESLKIAGFNAANATSMADASIAIDRALHAAKLPPVEANDPSKINNARTIEQIQTELPNLNLRTILDGLRFGEPDRLILLEPRYLPTLSKVLAERPIQDIRDYVKLRVILAYSPFLSSDFDKPLLGLNQGLVGVSVLPSQEERALDVIKGRFGQPVSRLYSDSFFPSETRRQAAEMVGLIKAAFQDRMPNRRWLSDATRSAATDKLNALSFWIGYPDEWVNYSSVEITPDLVSSLVSIARFDYERMRQKLGKPWVAEHFNTSHTLPIVVNAAYNPQINGFEVPAAIIQAPMFDASADPAVNFCRMGAVLGHEMTHGFDWTGKQFDKTGNMKNWWTSKDSAAFDALAGQLITQANEYEFLPGSRTATGAQQVGENMADLGGITLAHAALRKYLALNPEKDVLIDGQTQDQRCFLAWAQFWAWQGKDEALRSQVARDAHPPNAYRATAALRHLDAFYKAFGIKAGDPMWLAPERRVEAW